MIHGIGIDIVRTERIRDAVVKWGDRFLRRVFTEEEITYSYKKKEPYISLAVRFAAKEALIKAIGNQTACSMNDIEVVNQDSGRPSIRVKGGLESFFSEHSLRCVHLSLSHEREYGVACVVVEK